MQFIRRTSVLAGVAIAAATAFAGAASAAQYISIVQSIDVNKPADVVWKKVGGFCSIHDWLGGVPHSRDHGL